MANLTQYIDFTAVFQIDGPTLILRNTGDYSGTPVTTRWRLPIPSGAVLTATGDAVTIILPRATDGEIMQGVYGEIECIVNDGTDDSSLKKPAIPLSLVKQQPKLSQQADYSIPKIVYTDEQGYTQARYNTPSVVRSWSATRSGFNGAITSAAATFDLAQSGYYYYSAYKINLDVTATYTFVDTDLDWVTVIASYTLKDSLAVKLFPPRAIIMGWLKNVKQKDCGCSGSCGCGGYRSRPSEAYSVFGLMTDYSCAGDNNEAYCLMERLYTLTHNGQRYRPAYDNSILQPVQLCPGSAQVACGPAATSFTFSNVTASTVQINIVGSALLTYDLVIQPANKTFLNVVNGQTLTGLTANTTYTAPILTTRCTGMANIVTGTGFSTPTSVSQLVITTNPQGQAITAGQSVTFTSAASGGTTPYTYQWQLSTDGGSTFNDINGGTSASYSFSNVQLSQTGYQYRVRVRDNSNPQQETFSSVAVLTVNQQVNNLQITQQPTAQTVNEGSTATFTVVATATSGPLSYQWQFSTDGGATFLNISGATAATYAIINTLLSSNGYQFRVIVTGTGTTPATVTSNAVSLTVNAVVTYGWELWVSKDSTTDPFVNTTTAPNLNGGQMITSGTISSPSDAITIPTNAPNYSLIDNRYLVLIMDNGINARTSYQNGLSSGSIPGSVFRPLVTAAGKKDHISSDTWALNVNDPIIFS